jgi:thiamine-phosphate pyrophosphorylase
MSAHTQLHRGIYLITEHERLRFSGLLARTEAVITAGISALQYRNKRADRKQRLAEASLLQQLCNDHEVPFIINDDIDLALELGAAGVHLGREDGNAKEARLRVGENMLIGISCYNDLDRADQAVRDGADYIAFGAMFPTTSKVNAVSATTDLIRQAKQRYTVPIVAIGGITPENCGPVIAAGADLLAVISGVYLAHNPYHALETFNQLMAKQ